MKVTQERDGEAVEPGWPATQGDILAHHPRAVGRNERGIERERAHASAGCKLDKFSSGRRQ